MAKKRSAGFSGGPTTPDKPEWNVAVQGPDPWNIKRCGQQANYDDMQRKQKSKTKAEATEEEK